MEHIDLTEIAYKLYNACSEGNLEQVKEYLNIGNILLDDFINCKFSHGTPLFEAIRCCNFELAEYLIENGANVNEIVGFENSMSLLHFSIISEIDYSADRCLDTSENIILLLIESGANVNNKDELGKTPLDLTMKLYYEKAITILKKNGAQNSNKFIEEGGLNHYYYNKFWEECRSGNVKGIKNYLKFGDFINGINENLCNTPLIITLSHRFYESVEFILENGANINFIEPLRGNSPLHDSIYWDFINYRNNPNYVPDIKFIKLLIDYGADKNKINRDGYTPLDYSIKLFHKNAEAYLKGINSVNSQKFIDEDYPLLQYKNIYYERLIDACYHKNFYVIKECIKYINFDNEESLLKTVNFHWQTPLIMSIFVNDKEIFEYLILNGANVNTKNKGGSTPLNFAINLNENLFVDLLKKNGAKTSNEL
jgi:ankyrin repeat protein